MAKSRPLAVPWVLAVLGALAAGLGCSGATQSPYDPYIDATHLPRLGQGERFGRNPDPVPLSGSKKKRRPTPGRFGRDIDRLQRLVEVRWAHRETHERLDDVDIDAIFERLRARVDRSTSQRDYVAAVRRAVCDLSDANLRIVDPPSSTLRDSGLRFDVANGALLVARSTDRRYSRTPKPGEMVIAVDGRPTSRYLDKRCEEPASSPPGRHALAADRLGTQHRSAGQSASPRNITLRAASGKTYNVKLRWDLARPLSTPCVVADRPDPSLGVVRIQRFGCEETADGKPQFEHQLARALAKVADAPNVAIDLRRTSGANVQMAKLAASHLAQGANTWIRGRRADGGPFVDVPLGEARGTAGGTPRWGMIGPRCSELCEVFAAVLATSTNIVMIGSQTAGAVGRGVAEPKHYTLPSLGLVVALPDTVYARPGTNDPLEWVGVRPAIEVRATFDTVQRGRDAVVDGVLRRLAQTGP